MEILIQIAVFAGIVIAAYFALSALYFLVFSLAYHFYREKKTVAKTGDMPQMAILLPAYKEDAVIIESARASLAHKSELAVLSTWVMADKLQPETIATLKDMGVNVVEVKFEKSTKSKSLNEAMKLVPTSTKYIVVLDADNIMQNGFADEMVARMEAGFRVVQGHRTSKNTNTSMAVLDSISEEVNNSIFRMGHRVTGLSASLIGSAFCIEYGLFKDLMAIATAVGGFDKEMEIMLLERGIRIGYARNAVVFDEKVQKTEVFVNQRRRWLSAQLVYFQKNTWKAFKLLFTRGNIDFFDKVLQFILPPRIIALGFSGLLFAVFGVLHFAGLGTWLTFFAMAWAAIFLVNSLAVFMAIPRRLYNGKMAKALLSLPGGFFFTLLALLKIKGANKSFIHTQHGVDNNNKM